MSYNTIPLPTELLLHIVGCIDKNEWGSIAASSKQLRALLIPQIYEDFEISFEKNYISILDALFDPDSLASQGAVHTKTLRLAVFSVAAASKRYIANIQTDRIRNTGKGYVRRLDVDAVKNQTRRALRTALSRFLNVERVVITDEGGLNRDKQPLEKWFVKDIQTALRKMPLKAVDIQYWLSREVPLWVVKQPNLLDITVRTTGYEGQAEWDATCSRAMAELFKYPALLKRLNLDLTYSDYDYKMINLTESNFEREESARKESPLAKLFDLEQLEIRAPQLTPSLLRGLSHNIRNLKRLTIENSNSEFQSDQRMWETLQDLGIHLSHLEAYRMYDKAMESYIRSYSGLIGLRTSPLQRSLWFSREDLDDARDLAPGRPSEFSQIMVQHKDTLKVLYIFADQSATWAFDEHYVDYLSQLSNLETFGASCLNKNGYKALLQFSESILGLKKLELRFCFGFRMSCGSAIMGEYRRARMELIEVLVNYDVPGHSTVQELVVDRSEKLFRRGRKFDRCSPGPTWG